MIYKSIKEAVECLLYWQSRALEAEKEVEESLDYIELLLKEHDKRLNETAALEDKLNNQSIDEYVARTLYNERRRGMVLGVDGDR